MYQQFLLFAEKLMKLSFSETTDTNRPALVLFFSSKSEVFVGMLPPVVLHCPEEISSPDPLCPLSASTVRHLYLRGGVGVGSMTKIYGGRKRNGVCPSHFSVGSKNVARKVLQALEGLKMVEKDPNGWVACRLLLTICDLYYCRGCCFWVPLTLNLLLFSSGRRLTPQGTRDLDRIAGQVRSVFRLLYLWTWVFVTSIFVKSDLRHYWFSLQVRLLKLVRYPTTDGGSQNSLNSVHISCVIKFQRN